MNVLRRIDDERRAAVDVRAARVRVDGIHASAHLGRARIFDGQPVQARDVVVADARVDVGAARVQRRIERHAARRRLTAARLLDLLARGDADCIGAARGEDRQRRQDGKHARDGSDPPPALSSCRLVVHRRCPFRYYATRRRRNFEAKLARVVAAVVAAMVLGAGLGTRLRPLTDLVAKALVPVGDRPALAHVLDRLRSAGIERIVVNAHHRADDVVAFARACAIAASQERELLGTAGGVARAAALLGEGDVVVYNADIVAEIDLGALAREHAANAAGGADATLVVRPRAPHEGNVGIARDGSIVRLRNERFGEENRGGDFAGVHVLGAPLRQRLPERGCLVGDVYIPALSRGATLRALPLLRDAPLFDLGTPGAYLDANIAWLASRARTSFVAPGARVSGAVALDRSIVGEGAVVEGSGALSRVVVWPGGRARAPLSDAVVAGDRVVRT